MDLLEILRDYPKQRFLEDLQELENEELEELKSIVKNLNSKINDEMGKRK